MKKTISLFLAILLFSVGQSFGAAAAPGSIPTWAKYTTDPIQRTDYVATVNRSVTTESDDGTSYAATVQQIEEAITTAGEAEWYGAIPNDGIDDSVAINAAMADYGHVILGYGEYTISAQLTPATGQWLDGQGRANTTLKKAFNGDLFSSFPTGSNITDLSIDGEGATYTGRILFVQGTTNNQYMRNFSITDCNGYCIEFEVDAGSQSTFTDGKIARYNGTGSGRYSVKISDTQQLSAVPRKFTNIETDGTLFADLGGGGGAEFSGGFWGGFRFMAETRSVRITGGRIGNVLTMDIDGHNNSITGCNIGPNLTILSGADANSIQANTMNGVVTDNSGNGRNMIDYPSVSYTPVWTASSSNPSLGNGTITGEQARSGDKITVSVELVVGSTTTFGTGTWRISLPKTPEPTTGITQTFPVWMTDSGTTQIIGMAYIVDGTGYIEIAIPGGLDLVDATHPWTWATGNMIRATFTYIL